MSQCQRPGIISSLHPLLCGCQMIPFCVLFLDSQCQCVYTWPVLAPVLQLSTDPQTVAVPSGLRRVGPAPPRPPSASRPASEPWPDSWTPNHTTVSICLPWTGTQICAVHVLCVTTFPIIPDTKVLIIETNRSLNHRRFHQTSTIIN